MTCAATILYAEDNIPLADTLVEVLSDFGYEVLHGPDGEAAMDLASRHSFDMLLTDLDMPRMGGLELVARLRMENPGLPVIVLTGNVPEGGLTAFVGMGHGPLILLGKPTTIGEVVESVDRALTLGALAPVSSSPCMAA